MATIVTKNIAIHHFDDAKEAYKSYELNDSLSDLLLSLKLAVEAKTYLDLYKQDHKLKLEDLEEETDLIRFIRRVEEEILVCMENPID